MGGFCVECGKVLKDDVTQCTNCGAPAHRFDTTAEQLDMATEAPTKRPLDAAKGIATALMACAALACGGSAVALFGAGGYLLHRFAVGTTVVFPWVMAGALSGGTLVVAAIAAMIIAAVFLLGAAELVRRVVALSRRPQEAETA